MIDADTLLDLETADTPPEANIGAAPACAALEDRLPEGQTPIDAASSLKGDTLAGSVVLLLSLTVLQRGIGFVREILFCRWLPVEQLGLWNMAFGFLMMAGPLVVLSLPGTFGRYANRYLQRGQLRQFIRRTAGLCAVACIVSVSGIYLARQWFAQLVFAEPERAELIVLLTFSLVAVVAFNFVLALFTALRQIRVVSGMELSNSLFFATAGGLLMWKWRCSAESMIVGYGIACTLSSLSGVLRLSRMWKTFPTSGEDLPGRQLWPHLLPMAMWTMVINLLWNMFDQADRYMIVHFSPGSALDALAEVGNYHSSRVLPVLLSSITMMISGIALPHLSHDWEAGRRGEVSERLNLLLKIWGMALTAGAAAILIIAPELFRVAFQNKYAGGLHVLPWTLTYCTWLGLSVLLQTYLWCAEKARMASLAALSGVIVNIALNIVLLPRMGLLGAVLATAAANCATLVIMIGLARHYGFHIHRGTLLVLALPITIPLGPIGIAAVLAAVALQTLTTDCVLSAAEKELFRTSLDGYLRRLGLKSRLSDWERGGE